MNNGVRRVIVAITPMNILSLVAAIGVAYIAIVVLPSAQHATGTVQLSTGNWLVMQALAKLGALMLLVVTVGWGLSALRFVFTKLPAPK